MLFAIQTGFAGKLALQAPLDARGLPGLISLHAEGTRRRRSRWGFA